jgi:hypothetical protein
MSLPACFTAFELRSTGAAHRAGWSSLTSRSCIEVDAGPDDGAWQIDEVTGRSAGGARRQARQECAGPRTKSRASALHTRLRRGVIKLSSVAL